MYVIPSKIEIEIEIVSVKRCECTELDDWSSCNDGYMWIPSTCACERDKACKTGEYLDIKIVHAKNVYYFW